MTFDLTCKFFLVNRLALKTLKNCNTQDQEPIVTLNLSPRVLIETKFLKPGIYDLPVETLFSSSESFQPLESMLKPFS